MTRISEPVFRRGSTGSGRIGDYTPPCIGAWRSLVARIPWADEVLGSNPGAPTSPVRSSVDEPHAVLLSRRLAERLVTYVEEQGGVHLGAREGAPLDRLDVGDVAGRAGPHHARLEDHQRAGLGPVAGRKPGPLGQVAPVARA